MAASDVELGAPIYRAHNKEFGALILGVGGANMFANPANSSQRAVHKRRRVLGIQRNFIAKPVAVKVSNVERAVVGVYMHFLSSVAVASGQLRRGGGGDARHRRSCNRPAVVLGVALP